MNARRRSIDKWKEDPINTEMSIDELEDDELDDVMEEEDAVDDDYCTSPAASPESGTDEMVMVRHHLQSINHAGTALTGTTTAATLLSSLGGQGTAAISMQRDQSSTNSNLHQMVQQQHHQHPNGTTVTLTRYPDGTLKATPISVTSTGLNGGHQPTAVLVATANPAAVVQQLHPNQTTSNALGVSHDTLTSTALDL